MKKLVLVLGLVFSMNVMANDGGMAFIDVKGIAPVKHAQDGTEIKFYGVDAANFMRLLPEYSSVVYSMVSPQAAAELKKNERGVAVMSKGWALMFNCSGGELDMLDTEDGMQYQNSVFLPKQPECTISLQKGVDKEYLGDHWSMEPKDYAE